MLRLYEGVAERLSGGTAVTRLVCFTRLPLSGFSITLELLLLLMFLMLLLLLWRRRGGRALPLQRNDFGLGEVAPGRLDCDLLVLRRGRRGRRGRGVLIWVVPWNFAIMT